MLFLYGCIPCNHIFKFAGKGKEGQKEHVWTVVCGRYHGQDLCPPTRIRARALTADETLPAPACPKDFYSLTSWGEQGGNRTGSNENHH